MASFILNMVEGLFSKNKGGKGGRGRGGGGGRSGPSGRGGRGGGGRWRGGRMENAPAMRLRTLLTELFHFASPEDMILILIGTIAAVVHGASYPILALIFGNVSDTFISQSHGGFADIGGTNNTTSLRMEREEHKHHHHHHNASSKHDDKGGGAADNPFVMLGDAFKFVGKVLGVSGEAKEMSKEEFVAYAQTISIYFLGLAVLVFIASLIQTICWETAAENQTLRMRKEFMSQMLRQEISWFEKSTTGYLIAKLADDVERVQDGIGHKFSIVLEYCSCFAVGAFLGFCINWKLTFISGLSVPFILGKISYLLKEFAAKAVERQESSSNVGSVAAEVMPEVRTVASFGNEKHECKIYQKELMTSFKESKKMYLMVGFGTGILYLLVYGAFGAASLYASSQLLSHSVSTRQVYTVFSCVSIAIVALANILPFITDLAYSQGCAQSVLKVINSQPTIDPYSEDGRKPQKFTGKIKVAHVTFSYPCRPDTQIIRDLSLKIKPGSPVAIVGASGEGKSTLVDLLLRFYDTQEGCIQYDGFDVKNLNLKWLRDNVSLVSADADFYADTIYNNLTGGDRKVTKVEAMRAATLACAHECIMELPQNYQTMIGISDRELSAGQSELLAIARAFIKRTKILILDEAYASQDMETVKKLTRNLKRMGEGRTIVVISRSVARIHTIDTINVMKDDDIVEVGNHAELMAKKGVYYEMALSEGLEDLPPLHTNELAVEELEDMDTTVMAHPRRNTHFKIDGDELEDLEALLRHPLGQDLFRRVKKLPNSYMNLSLGLIGCVLSGLVPPLFALVFSQLFIAFSESGSDLSRDSHYWAIMVFLIGIVAAVGFFMRTTCISAIGEGMSCFLRSAVYKSILKQKISWFDDEAHTPQRLYGILARNAPVFKTVVGSRFGMVVSTFISFLIAILIIMRLNWLLGIIVGVVMPLRSVIFFSIKKNITIGQLKINAMIEEILSHATEAVQDIKGVQTLSLQPEMIDVFNVMADKISSSAKTQAKHFGVLFAISEAITFILFAVVFRLGAHLIDNGIIQPLQLFRIVFILTFCTFTLGQFISFIPDYISAKLAYANLYSLYGVDIPKEGKERDKGHKSPEIEGRIAFDHVFFTYPSRPESAVLQDISFELQAGKCLGIIGNEGKSTLMSLMLRLYDADSGVVSIDGIPIKELRVEWLREHVGYISQDPTLFNRSIHDNIVYGYRGDLEDEELDALVLGIADTVYLTDFVSTLADGFQTEVGTHGTSLNKGERQRIALARAIIRNPKILLLDEPTAGVGPDLRQKLLASLKFIVQTRTCVIVSHHRDEIKMADFVLVLGPHGKIIEYGTHEELDALGGAYKDFMAE